MTQSLLSKLSEAEEGSRELGHEVLLHFGWHRTCVGHFYGPLYQWSAPDRKPCPISGDEDRLPNPTLSIDAALALAERVLPGWICGIDTDGNAEIWDGKYVLSTRSAFVMRQPALALCIAILTAAQKETTHD